MAEHFHLIGIGGIGMSAIARLLLRSRKEISGSDSKENSNTRVLEQLGAKICIGHKASNVSGASQVIYSSAIKEDNPEIKEARRLGIRLVRRAEALAGLMADKSVITIAGSHGKTTTASLASCLLMEAGLSPTLAVGGVLRNIDTNACAGNGNFFVAEADESDGSFLCYKPLYSIVTNVDCEHLDYYKTFDKEKDAFRSFLNLTEKNGCVFYCDDDLNLKEIVEGYKGRAVSFGLNPCSDFSPEKIKFNALSSSFDCIYRGKSIGSFSLSLGGVHNISNALSVIALGIELGIGVEVMKKAFLDFKGAGRRLEIKFKGPDFIVLDDYAHHPTEIKATLSAVSQLKAKRVIAVFQPHRFTRTKILFNDFIRSFGEADLVFITDIYPAAEKPIKGISGMRLCEGMRGAGKENVYFSPRSDLLGNVMKFVRPGDLVITLGAGDIVGLSDELAEIFKNKA